MDPTLQQYVRLYLREHRNAVLFAWRKETLLEGYKRGCRTLNTAGKKSGAGSAFWHLICNQQLTIVTIIIIDGSGAS